MFHITQHETTFNELKSVFLISSQYLRSTINEKGSGVLHSTQNNWERVVQQLKRDVYYIDRYKNPIKQLLFIIIYLYYSLLYIIKFEF